jgi:hypothetical protein
MAERIRLLIDITPAGDDETITPADLVPLVHTTLLSHLDIDMHPLAVRYVSTGTSGTWQVQERLKRFYPFLYTATKGPAIMSVGFDTHAECGRYIMDEIGRADLTRQHRRVWGGKRVIRVHGRSYAPRGRRVG